MGGRDERERRGREGARGRDSGKEERPTGATTAVVALKAWQARQGRACHSRAKLHPLPLRIARLFEARRVGPAQTDTRVAASRSRVDRAASPRKRVTLSRDEDVIREVTASRTSSSSVQCGAKGSASSKAWSAPTGKLAVRSALRRLGSGVATKLLAFAERMRSFWIFWRRKHKVGQHRCEEDAHELCENAPLGAMLWRSAPRYLSAGCSSVAHPVSPCVTLHLLFEWALKRTVPCGSLDRLLEWDGPLDEDLRRPLD
ncbi:hypothetical protein MTO96_042594 [Rhipicephalus appendiculatus]